MLTALANYAIIALHNAQLVHDLREERTKLLSKEEEVRHQLARDLHDGPAQAFAAITMNVEFIKRLLERDPTASSASWTSLARWRGARPTRCARCCSSCGRWCWRPRGSTRPCSQYLERFQGNGIEIILETANISANLDTKTEGTLFNIIQESINNALKYAKADHIWVRLKQSPTTLRSTIQDDGRGFDLQKVLASYEQRGSFGLLNIEERAKLIGGIAELHSAPGAGTTVRVIVPLELTMENPYIAPARVKAALRALDLHPSRQHGRHFLIDPTALQAIVTAAELTPADTVLEVGPGLGVLTWGNGCADWGAPSAVELDRRLAERSAR